ncbi:hypothetical protein E1A91_A06G186600v1 [Gossypium mustelinum]|uniref:Serine/threonine-protein phosphatase 4 regulatory subunit 3-like central domain-containing protein n=1 Tax=Gossypium mustelinum TaxID=34275 RepID=A0A5D2YZL0_GOSMU|nr:hypothetical protein E1A91_A06G186600v1 [Gossypium mustelinum]
MNVYSMPIVIAFFFYFRRKSPPTSTHHSDENLLGFFIKCIEYSLFLDFECGRFECGGKYGEIDVEGRAFQRNAHVSYRAAQRLWEQRGSDQLSAIVVSLLVFVDVVLARVLDEATAASLNSIIHSNNAIVISILKDNSTFIQELFARLRSPTTSAESKKNLVTVDIGLKFYCFIFHLVYEYLLFKVLFMGLKYGLFCLICACNNSSAYSFNRYISICKCILSNLQTCCAVVFSLFIFIFGSMLCSLLKLKHSMLLLLIN